MGNLTVVIVAESESEGIGGIFGRWKDGEGEEELHHALYLLFTGKAIAHNGPFGLGGGVFLDEALVLFGGQDSHRPGHTQLEGALGVFEDKLGLNDDDIGIKLTNESIDGIVEDVIASIEVVFGRGFDSAIVERLALFDNAIARDACSWIDAQNDHVPIPLYPGIK